MARVDQNQLLAAVYDILKEHRKPTHITEITADLLAVLPLTTGRPRAAVRKALALGLHAVHYGDGRWCLMQNALREYSFRCTPHAQEIQAGLLFTHVRFTPFLPYYPAGSNSIRLVDTTGNLTISATVDHTPHAAIRLADWYEFHRFKAGDSLMVQATDLTAGLFQITYEPVAQKDLGVLERNRTFADAAFALFVRSRQEEVLADTLIPAVLAQRPEFRSAPPDDYRDVLARDGRFRLLEQGTVAAADFRRPIDYLYLFPKWGKAAFNALNPGYLTPVETGEEATPEPGSHWLRLLNAQVVSLEAEAGQVKLRLDLESSAGDFSSDLDLTLGPASRMTRTLLSTLRQRFKSLVNAQIKTSAAARALQQVTLEDEPQMTPRLTEFLRPLAATAKNPPDEATRQKLAAAHLVLAAPRTHRV